MHKKSFFYIGVCLVIIACSIYYYAQKNHTSTQIIILAPLEGPTKKRPEEPGGIIIPNADSLVYEKLQHTKQTTKKINILPGPEQPMELRIADDSEPVVVFLDSIDEILANIEYYENLSEVSESTDEIGDYIVPNLINTKLSDEPTSDNSINISGRQLNVIKATENRFSNLYEKSTLQENGYKVQLSVALSYNDAQAQWQEIFKRHAKILKNTSLITSKAKGKNDRILYIVMAGPYSSLSKAKSVCKRLIYRRQSCIVTK